MTDRTELNTELTGRVGKQRVGNGTIETKPEATVTVEVNNGMAKLYAKLARVMGKIAPVEKTGQNNFHHYKFQTAEAIANAVRVILAEEGIAFFASMRNVSQTQTQDTKGKPTTLTTVMFDFTFACGETGATITHQWAAESINNSDKGINQVATAATKYFLMKTFLISTPDESDADSGYNERRPIPTPKTKSTAPETPEAKSEPLPRARKLETKPDEPVVEYDLGKVIGQVAFMYNAYKHAENSVRAMVKSNEIEPNDSTLIAVGRVFFHRVHSEPLSFTDDMVFAALSAAMEAEGSAVPIASLKQWLKSNKTIQQAWEAVNDYHENEGLPPAQPKDTQQQLPGTPPEEVDF